MDEAALRKQLEAARAMHTAYASLQEKAQQATVASLAATKQSGILAEKIFDAKTQRARDYADHCHQLSQAKELEEESLDNTRRVLLKDLGDAETTEILANRNLNDVTSRAQSVTSIPNVKECVLCPLAKAGIQARESIPELQAKAKTASENKTQKATAVVTFEQNAAFKLGAFIPVPENDFNSGWDKKSGMAELQQKATEAISEASRASEEAKTAQNRVEASKALLPPLEPLEKGIQEATKAAASLMRLDALLQSKRKDYDAVKTEIDKFEIPAFDDSIMEELASKLIGARTTAATADSMLASANLSIGRQEAKIEEHRRRREEIGRIDTEIATKEEFVFIHEALSKAGSRDGIPQLIADSAIPHFEEKMRELLAECESRWTVKVTSQRENKSGTVQERIDILVDDGEGERDISTYSGGELNLLSVVVRMAFAIMQAERSGRGLKVIVLDETMFFADDANSDCFMSMVNKLSGRFNQIFIVSHKDYVLAAVPDKLIFSLGSDGRTVVKEERSGKAG